MKGKFISTILLLVSISLLTCCSNSNKNNTKDFLNSTQKNDKETTTTGSGVVVDTQSYITKQFLEKRYPDKIIVNYMYAEPESFNGKTEHRYSDRQMVAVNDYLVEHGQDYIIYFMPVAMNQMSIDYVKEVMNGDNAPDIITSVGYNNDVVDNSTQKMVFNGVYEDLDKYKDTATYERLIKDYPEKLYEMSLYNKKFYGFKTNIFAGQTQYYVYNSKVAEKYGIKKSDIEGKSLTDIDSVIDRIKGWKKEYKNTLATSYLYMDSLNFIGVNFYFDNYERTPVFWLDCIGVDAGTGNDIMAITDSEIQKAERKAEYDMYKKGYSCVNGIIDKEHYYGTYEAGNEVVNSFMESISVTKVGEETNGIFSYWNDIKDMTLAKGKTRYTTEIGGWAIINGICSTSKNKEKALEAMAYICSDKTLSNILVNGLASTDYELKNYEPTGESDYSSSGEASLANQYIVNDTDDINRELSAKSMKDAAIETEIEGYYFDLSDYKAEVEAIKQIQDDFLGAYDIPELYSDKYSDFEEAWSDFKKQLEDAGIKEVVAEINRQRTTICN